MIISPVTEDMANQSHGVHVSDQTDAGQNEAEIGQTLLQTADIATGRMIEEQHWISLRVRTFQEPGLEGKFRIRSYRGQSLVSKIDSKYLLRYRSHCE